MTLEEMEKEIQRALRSDLPRARRLVARYARRAGRDPKRRAMAAFERAQLAHVMGDHRRAARAYEEARRGFKRREDLFMASMGAVQVRADAMPDRRFAGTVYAIDPRIDSTTRTLVVRARVPNEDGRLRPGMTAVEARAGLQPYFHSLLEMEVTQPAFNSASAETRRRFLATQVELDSAAHGRSGLRRTVESPLWILMAVASGVLLIACLNVANLLLARGTARYRELALRLALGASRRRIVRLLLVESLAVAGAGAALGLVLAQWGAALLLSFFASPDGSPAISASPDLRIMGFAALAAVGSALVAGLVPAFQSSSVALAPALKAAGGAVVREQPRLRQSLVVARTRLPS